MAELGWVLYSKCIEIIIILWLLWTGYQSSYIECSPRYNISAPKEKYFNSRCFLICFNIRIYYYPCDSTLETPVTDKTKTPHACFFQSGQISWCYPQVSGGRCCKKEHGQNFRRGGWSSIPMVFCVLISEEAKCFLGLFHSWASASVFSRPGGANSLKPVALSPKSGQMLCCTSLKPALYTPRWTTTQPHHFTNKEKLSQINPWN